MRADAMKIHGIKDDYSHAPIIGVTSSDRSYGWFATRL